MRFEREQKPHAEPISADELKEGSVYFFVNFVDGELLIPTVEPVVFVGRNLEPDEIDRVDFQDIYSYRDGTRYDTTDEDHPAEFQTGSENELGHVFEYEQALDATVPTLNRLTGLAGTIAGYTYEHDGTGNITHINDTVDAAYDRTFGYDDLGRLVTANSGAALWGNGGYTYDRMGNMLTAALGSQQRTFTYQGTSPKIQTAPGLTTQMAYDAAGNELDSPAGRASDGSPAIGYSARNLVATQFLREYDRCDQPGQACGLPDLVQVQQSNLYDGRGVRVMSVETEVSGTIGIDDPPPTNRYYYYTPELEMLNVVAPSTHRTADVIWFGSHPIADHGLSELRYTFTDHLGTPILQTTPTAAVVWRVEYEPYGTVYTTRAGTADDQPLRFPDQQVAYATPAGEESYNIFRWYRSGWGRYTTPDPIGVGGQGHFDPRSGSLRTFNAVDAERGATIGASSADSQANLYAYAAANSLRYVDRLGLWPCIVFSVNSTADYMPQISGPIGSTFKGCLYTGICGTPNYQYLAVYERGMKLGCKCPTFCIFQIDLNSGVRTTPGTCFDIPWPALAPSPPLVGPLW